MRLRSILAVAGAAVLGAAATALHAQTPGTTAVAAADYLFKPVPDGDPNAPGVFRPAAPGQQPGKIRPKAAPAPTAPSRLQTMPDYGKPAWGAGTTGFVSSGPKRPKPKAPGTAHAALVTPQTVPPAAPPSPEVAPSYRRPQPASANRAGAVADPYAVAAPPTGALGRTKRPKTPPEDDPFAPVGLTAGSFVLKPAIEMSAGYDTNPAHAQIARGSTYYVLAPELAAQSQWSRHELTANVKGSYTGFITDSTFDHPALDSKVDGRIDVTRDTRVDLEGRYLISTDSPGSPDLPSSLSSLPLNQTWGATVGLGRRFNRFDIAAKSTFDRNIFANGTLNDGTPVDNRDRNYDQYGFTLRGSYELTPGVKPFVEVGGDKRVHDLPVDFSGIARDSTGRTWRIGSTFELTRKLTGEISAGWLTRDYEDPLLTPLSGFVYDASLVWSATALTNIKFTAKSTADESTLVGTSGVLKRDIGIEIDHSLRRWLTASVKLGWGLDDYQGLGRVDDRYTGSAGLTYKLSRTLQIKGEVRREWLRSNVDGQDYTATALLVGLRLQR